MAGSRLTGLGSVLLLAGTSWAGQADVLHVEVQPGSIGGTFDFTVSVRHADSGWDHYANRWEIIGPQGTVLATRTLLHPHVEEQPFTRSLRNVKIPTTTTWVRVRANDLVHGAGGRMVTVSVPHPSADGR